MKHNKTKKNVIFEHNKEIGINMTYRFPYKYSFLSNQDV